MSFDFNAKTIALVGNGPISEAGFYIDACDEVIRCNDYDLDPEHRGVKVTQHAVNATAWHFVRDDDSDIIGCVPRDRIARVPHEWLTDPRVMWMSADFIDELTKRLRLRPSIGCMLLHWIDKFVPNATIRLAGFSWSNEGMSPVHDLTDERRLYDENMRLRKKVILL